MNWLDIIILIPLIGGLISGFKNGIIGEIAMLAALILGVWGAIEFSWWTSDLLIDMGVKTEYLHIISFIITFVLIVLIIQLLAKFVNQLLESLALGFFNRIAGMIIGVAKSALIIGVILFALETFDDRKQIIPDDVRDNSALYKPLSGVVPAILPFLPFERIHEDRSDGPEEIYS